MLFTLLLPTSNFILNHFLQESLFCDVYGNQCFENSMKNDSTENMCDCPMECNYISYSYSVVSTPFDPAEMCPAKAIEEDFLMKPFYTTKDPPQFIRRLMEFKDNISSDDFDYCKRNIQYRAMVIFRLATTKMSVTVMSKRLTFFDQLSDFGKHELLNNLINLINQSIHRWNSGLVHWHQYPQCS